MEQKKEIRNEKIGISKKYDTSVIIISFVVVMALVIGTLISPEGANAVSSSVFKFITQTLGSPILLFVFGCLAVCLYLAFSKYGNIRMGNSEPDFSTFSYISMMICSGFGSGTIYWAFLEFAYYLQTPPFGAEPGSIASYDWASAYNLHHWGPAAWCLYCIASLPITYSYYIRKNKNLRVSTICKDFVPEKMSGVFGRFIDYVFVLATIAGIAIVVTLGAPIIATGISSLTGIPNGFGLSTMVIVAIAIIYTITSYVGIEKGMRRISDYGIYLLLIFFGIIVVFGPTQFIIDQTTTGLGMLLQNIVKMSLYTDAVGGGGFPQNWTVWFWSYWFIYAPFMGVFVTRVSKGRTLREIILCMVGGGAFGTGLFLVATNAFSMHADMTGLVPVSDMLMAGNGNEAIIALIGTLPFSKLVTAMFLVCTVLLLATTLDGSSFSLATNTQKIIAEGAEPSKMLRVFWCLILTLLPLTLIYIKAPIGTIQVCALAFSIPIIIMIIIMVKGMFKNMIEDYGHKTNHEIYMEGKIEE